MSSAVILDDDMFDGVGRFGFDAEHQYFIVLDVPAIELRKTRTDTDPTWPCIQYWQSAAFWNQFPRRRITLDDALALRIGTMTAKDRRLLKGWVAERRQPGGYSQVFAGRVARALGG
jgi:hypothetical protein